MRLDKFLKVSRLIKRRTVAKDFCEGEKISVNGKIAKPSAKIKPGDIITLELRNNILEVRVLATPASVRADEASTLFEVLKEEKRA
ncbi:MAG: RNA-binding S4 domain-containing protein [Peptococcaceae bacterium]|nr:RNA-binding S4 domain-containing protein [Peptococcaceae bacterium]